MRGKSALFPLTKPQGETLGKIDLFQRQKTQLYWSRISLSFDTPCTTPREFTHFGNSWFTSTELRQSNKALGCSKTRRPRQSGVQPVARRTHHPIRRKITASTMRSSFTKPTNCFCGERGRGRLWSRPWRPPRS